MRREDASAQVYQQRLRIFKAGDEWFFTTREGVNMGPFDSKENAEKSISELIN